MRLSRWRVCAICATLLASPLAHAQQSPIAPQGQSPTVSPRPSVDPVRPASYDQSKPSLPPRLLPPDLLQPPPWAGPKVDVKLTKFDPLAAEVKHEGRSWQLWSAKTILRDFGENRSAAYEARRLVAELRLTEHGTIGTPEPVMEYWLTNGAAPAVPPFSRNIIPFEPKGLRVLDDQGTFSINDGRRKLFNFGPHEADAKAALDVLRRYEFNELGFVGSPGPAMTYLLRNDSPTRRHFTPLGELNQIDEAPSLAPRYPLEVPGLGRVGERRPFDPMRIEIRRGNDGWHLVTSTCDLGSAGATEYQARTAMQIAQRYPLNEYVRIGKSDFGFFLSNAQAPRGAPLGVRRSPFEAKALMAKPANGMWVVTDGRQNIATFGKEDDAKLAIKVMKHYGFNCACEAGALHYFAQDN